MNTYDTIPRNRQRPTVEDYDALRKLGLEYIEQFSRELWTDFNIHDPGITTMEALCYAITDLGYRTGLPMEDLLARAKEDTTKDFFTAREILPCNPVTLEDLRKKIIDVAGVENAWVSGWMDEPCADPLEYPAYFIKCDPPNQRFTINANLPATGESGYEARNIDGLYRFQLLMEEDPVLGDINIPSVDWEMSDAVTGRRRALVRFIFPVTIEKKYPGKVGEVSLVERLSEGSITGFTITNFAGTLRNTFDLELNFGAQSVKIDQVAFHIRPVQPGLTMAELRDELEIYLLSANAAIKTEIISKIFQRFSQKVARVSAIIDAVYCMYQRIRNLCEDVICIGIVPSQEIALCADIETEPGADLEQILGTLYFETDTFFSPPVRFYLLQQMMAMGYKVQHIFEGPLLRHGFITDESLRQSVLFDRINLSDLYQLIMNIPGVKTVKYLQITNYLHGIPQTEGIPSSSHPSWTLLLGGFFHLNLDRLRSKITFFKGNMPITADRQVADRIYADLKASIARPRINTALGGSEDLPVPQGTPYHLEDYYSMQNEFPATYGVGPDGIPSGSDMERKTNIKQFKGFLLFFDQILANYLSQLAHLKDLYSVSQTGTQTYFMQPVYDVPTPKDEEMRNFFGTAPLLKDYTPQPNVPGGTLDLDDEDTFDTSWNNFIDPPGPVQNNYMKQLKKMVEIPDDLLDRPNRFLDHLLARFGESFSDYAAMLYNVTGVTMETSGLKTGEEIAVDKRAFLSEYPLISYNRGKGQYVKNCAPGVDGLLSKEGQTDAALLEYDFFNPPLPSNAAGLQKRASRLLGMQISDNDWLVLERFLVTEVSPGKFGFEIVYNSDGDKVKGTLEYASEKEAFQAIEQIVAWSLSDQKATVFGILLSAGQHFITINKPDTTLVAESTIGYATPLLAQQALEDLFAAFYRDGIKVVDHLLLRPLPISEVVFIVPNPGVLLPDDPKLESVGFFPLCAELNPDCDCPETDYYSFRISVILPYWAPRLRNMDFRHFAESTMHRETPAHILPKFCWVSMYDMWRLETAYKDWFGENKKYKPNMSVLRPRLKKLISVLNTLTNVYPEGHLHDCDNPGTDNPVILNQTILGTF